MSADAFAPDVCGTAVFVGAFFFTGAASTGRLGVKRESSGRFMIEKRVRAV